MGLRFYNKCIYLLQTSLYPLAAVLCSEVNRDLKVILRRHKLKWGTRNVSYVRVTVVQQCDDSPDQRVNNSVSQFVHTFRCVTRDGSKLENFQQQSELKEEGFLVVFINRSLNEDILCEVSSEALVCEGARLISWGQCFALQCQCLRSLMLTCL